MVTLKEIIGLPEEPPLDLDDRHINELYDRALAFVAETQQASISIIQRRMRCGFEVAAKIIEQMERDGVVGPSDGTAKPRKVYTSRIKK